MAQTFLQIQMNDELLVLWQKLQAKYSQKSEAEIFYELVITHLNDWEKWDEKIVLLSQDSSFSRLINRKGVVLYETDNSRMAQ